MYNKKKYKNLNKLKKKNFRKAIKDYDYNNLDRPNLNVREFIKENKIKDPLLLKILLDLEKEILLLNEELIKLNKEKLSLNDSKIEIEKNNPLFCFFEIDFNLTLKKKIQKIDSKIFILNKKMCEKAKYRDDLFVDSACSNDHPRFKNSIKLDNIPIDLINNVNEVVIIVLFSDFSLIKNVEAAKTGHKKSRYSKSPYLLGLNETYQTFYKLLLINFKDLFDSEFRVFVNYDGSFVKLETLLNKLDNLDISCIQLISDSVEKPFSNIVKSKGKLFKFNSLNLSTFIDELKKKLYFKEGKGINKNNLHLINNEHNKTIYMFTGLNWSTIVQEFKNNGITFLTGNNDTKHLISPLDFKLSNLTSTIFGKKGYNYVVKSFNKSSKEIYQRKGSNLINISKIIVKPSVIDSPLDLDVSKNIQSSEYYDNLIDQYDSKTEFNCSDYAYKYLWDINLEEIFNNNKDI